MDGSGGKGEGCVAQELRLLPHFAFPPHRIGTHSGEAQKGAKCRNATDKELVKGKPLKQREMPKERWRCQSSRKTGKRAVGKGGIEARGRLQREKKLEDNINEDIYQKLTRTHVHFVGGLNPNQLSNTDMAVPVGRLLHPAVE